MQKKVYYALAFCFVLAAAFLTYQLFAPQAGTVEILGEGVYTGQLRNGVFHGRGTWVSESGLSYSGQFKNGLYHGTGTLTFADGYAYTGEFEQGFIKNTAAATDEVCDVDAPPGSSCCDDH